MIPAAWQPRALSRRSQVADVLVSLGIIWSIGWLGAVPFAEAGGGFCTPIVDPGTCGAGGCLSTQKNQTTSYNQTSCGSPSMTCVDSTDCGAIANSPPVVSSCTSTESVSSSCGGTFTVAGFSQSCVGTARAHITTWSPSGCSSPSGWCVEEPPCSSWQPFGYAKPGDPIYGFPWAHAVVGGVSRPAYPWDPNNPADAPYLRPVIGLAAKGNIIVGDYTSAIFQNSVLPALQANRRAYAIDPTDEALGYHTGVDLNHDGQVTADEMYEHSDPTKPLFNGDYTQPDGGSKRDGTPRKFYESSLSNADFLKLINRTCGGSDPIFNGPGCTGGTGVPAVGAAGLEAMLYTNHALAGFVEKSPIWFRGGLVARDDGLMWRSGAVILHEPRAMNPVIAQRILLPITLKHPQMVSLQDCDANGVCPP